MILIDGVEGDLNYINPKDIASVSVLKDASSSAIYGARAAFGVVLISTKNPGKGAVQVNYSNHLVGVIPQLILTILLQMVWNGPV